MDGNSALDKILSAIFLLLLGCSIDLGSAGSSIIFLDSAEQSNSVYPTIDRTNQNVTANPCKNNKDYKQNGLWITEDKGRLTVDGTLITVSDTLREKVDHCSVMWLGSMSNSSTSSNSNSSTCPSFMGLVSGESYWTTKFGDLGGQEVSVGVTSKDRLKKGYATRGLFYGGNLHNGLGDLVPNFGPAIKSNDVIGVLASFYPLEPESDSNSDSESEETSKPKSKRLLRLYFFNNGRSLGLGFEVPAALFLPSGVHPVIQFEKPGSAQITVETVENFPNQETRQRKVKKLSGLEGSWRVVPDSLFIKGRPFKHQAVGQVTMQIERPANDSEEFKISLTVINRISFFVQGTSTSKPMGREAESSWTIQGQALTTLIGVWDGDLQLLENTVSKLVQFPDSVKVSGDEMTIKRGKSRAEFVRFDDSPTPFFGNPFA